MLQEKRLAVLIDSDNVSAKYAQFIMQEVEKYGIPTYKRVYGDWEKGGNGWHNAAINYSIMAVQQCSYIAGKNATDFSMIIDAMDILYTGNVDGFCLVTSDSDFTRLAIRLREAGKLVVGIGELKTPRAFTVSCHHFCYLNQLCEPETMQDEKAIRKTVLDYVTEHNGERIDLAKLGGVLTSRFGNINYDELGYKRFSSYIDSFSELSRSNTFVSLKKQKKSETQVIQQPDVDVNPDKVTEEQIVSAIKDYFNEYAFQNDNLMKIESYLSSRFGKLDYSRFGSKKFAKFIDKQNGFKRDGTSVVLVDSIPQLTAEIFAEETLAYAKENSPKGGNAGQLNNYLIGKYGKNYFKQIGFEDFRTAVASVEGISADSNSIYLKEDAPLQTVETVTIEKAGELIRNYAAEHLPHGGNIGQLNNVLIDCFGKNYCSELGFADYKSLLTEISGVTVKKNRIYPAIVQEQPVEPVESEIIAQAEPDTENEVEISAADVQEVDFSVTEPVVEELPADEPVSEKPDMNAIRRDVLNFVATSEKGGSLSALGKALDEKYGKGVLKEIGFTSMRKLAAEVGGVVIRSNKLYIDEAFAAQTEQIEQFVIEYANSEGKRSIRALGMQLKKNFEGFDFRKYGFDKFTDFINAIDGVKADRYHVAPVKES